MAVYFDLNATTPDRIRSSLASANRLLNEQFAAMDAATAAAIAAAVPTSIEWGIITGTPTTIAGYGITDSMTLTSSGSPPVGTGAVGLFHIDTSANRFYWGQAGSWYYVSGTLLVSSPAPRATRLTAMGVPGVFAEYVYGP